MTIRTDTYREIDKITIRTDRQGHITAIVTGLTADGYMRFVEYRTGKDRRGLWKFNFQRRDWEQIVEAEDFKVSKPADLRRRLQSMLLAQGRRVEEGGNA